MYYFCYILRLYIIYATFVCVCSFFSYYSTVRHVLSVQATIRRTLFFFLHSAVGLYCIPRLHFVGPAGAQCRVDLVELFCGKLPSLFFSCQLWITAADYIRVLFCSKSRGVYFLFFYWICFCEQYLKLEEARCRWRGSAGAVEL